MVRVTPAAPRTGNSRRRRGTSPARSTPRLLALPLSVIALCWALPSASGAETSASVNAGEPGATASGNAGGLTASAELSSNVLQVVENNQSYTLDFDPKQNFSGAVFELTSDKGGGTDITLMGMVVSSGQIVTVSSGQTSNFITASCPAHGGVRQRACDQNPSSSNSSSALFSSRRLHYCLMPFFRRPWQRVSDRNYP